MVGAMSKILPFVVWFEALGRDDVPRVGGKNASLGEMVCHLASHGVRVPPGFATTAHAYWQFVAANDLKKTIVSCLDDLAAGKVPLSEVGHAIRRAFLRGEWPKDIATAITAAYDELCRRSSKQTPMSPFVQARQLKTFPMRALPASRSPTSISAARQLFSTLVVGVTLRCSPTGPSPIGRPRASIT